MHSHGSGILKEPDDISRIDEHLGGDAAVVQAGASGGALIHQRNLQALASGLRGDMRSRACADYNEVEFVHGDG